MLELTVIQGPDKGRTLTLQPGKRYFVGCEEGAALQLTDPMVLKGHCSVEAGDGFLVVRNHTARSGVFIGEKKIAQAKLRPPNRFRLGETVIAVAAARAQRKPTPGGRDLTGRIIGGYKLQEIVGRGGMGTVYRATQLSLHRDVAVKVLSKELAKDKAFTDLFINEARAAAQLIHPNVVQVYDAGSEGDISYFSMEFIGQGSVEEILARAEDNKLAWEQAILWILEAAHGLAYAEGKGIVHRDIKPDNLMVNEDGQCKIADLGLAKHGKGTEDRGIIGTPHFIPPEQALGKEVDSRADIYSLGATFFRMITGRTLFSGRTAKEIVLKHLNEPAPAASSLESSVPDDLDLVIARMLAKDPEKRYANAAELIAALEEICADHGIKGAIIKRGVGKRVLIPLVLALLIGAFVIYKLASRGVEVRDNPAAIAAAEAAKKKARQAQKETRRIQREKRRGDAKNAYLALENADKDEQIKLSLDSTYDNPATADAREREWLDLAGKFEAFAAGALAKEFETELHLSSKAAEHADKIRKRLAKVKAFVEDKRARIAEKVAQARATDKKIRDRLDDYRLRRQYNAAARLCARVAKPGKEDPFAGIAGWTYHNADFAQKARDIPAIMKVVQASRKFFKEQRRKTLVLATKDWQRVEQEQVAPLADDASDTRIREVIAALAKVCEDFPAPAGTPVTREIKALVDKARLHKRGLEKQLAKRQAARLGEDRLLVRNKQRRLASLDSEISPNLVMHCAFAEAIDTWQKLLGDLRTERYRAFVRERITMLRWCQYLFARFHNDLKTSLGVREKENRPFPSLDIDLPIPDSEKTLRTQFGKPTDNPYEFTTRKRLRGKSTFAFGRYPVDWIRDAVFFDAGKLRWKEDVPALRFALGAFCFETMQYAEAKRLFSTLAEDPIHGPVAKVLSARAAMEEQARYAWIVNICAASQKATTSAEIREIQQRARTYRNRFEGTIFYLEVMPQRATLTKDFYDETLIPKWPAVPAVPPSKE